jgi:hypothetical protein
MGYFPTIFASELLYKWYDATYLSEITNTSYEGEIKNQGDTVVIPTTPDITVNTHYRGQALIFEQPSSTDVTLLINKGKSWSFITNRIDDVVTHIKDYAQKWGVDAGEQLKVNIETDLLSNVYADVNAYNTGTTAGIKTGGINLGAATGSAGLAATKANILEILTDAAQALDEQSVPRKDRFILLPPWACGLIAKSDLKSASLSGDATSIMRRAGQGMMFSGDTVADFTVYMSNLLTVASDGTRNITHCIFGTKIGITFAAQLTENTVKDNPFGFGTLFAGLMVYGYKVVQPKALGDLIIYKG